MAEGGVALRPTRRLMGEAGPEAVIPLHRLGDIGRRMGGGGITVNIGGISGGGDLDAETVGRMVGAATTKALREDGAYRGQFKRVARRGL